MKGSHKYSVNFFCPNLFYLAIVSVEDCSCILAHTVRHTHIQHDFPGFRTRNPSKRPAVDTCPRPCGHRDRFIREITHIVIIHVVDSRLDKLYIEGVC